MLQISAPSKTFLFGEYAVLAGGAGCLATTSPSFVLKVERRSGVVSERKGIHPKSPAGLFLSDMRVVTDAFDFSFEDPHMGKGGFGASSAQFLLSYTFYRWVVDLIGEKNSRLLVESHSQSQRFWNNKSDQVFSQLMIALQDPKKNVSQGILRIPLILPEQLMEVYLTYAWDGQGRAPSGADLLAQKLGGIAIGPIQNMRSGQTWVFEDLGFLILRSGKKISTHSHLTSLKHHDFSALVELSSMAMQAMVEKNSYLFQLTIKKYYQELIKKNLVLDSTQEQIRVLEKNKMVLAAKGCGALGADVILVLCQTQDMVELQDSISAAGWNVVATSQQIEQGVQMQWSSGKNSLDINRLQWLPQ